MDQLKDRMKDFLRLCKKNPQYVKIAVIALVVITALVFFGAKGEKEEIPVIQTGETITEDVTTSVKPTVVTFVVDLDGCVKNPGIYEIDEGTRLYEVIEMAGGLTAEADTSLINQAEVLYDGQKIVIPEKTESADMTLAVTTDGRININQADSNMLQEIPGVGPTTAEKILAYREAHGRFQAIEDIKNVDGIGEKTFEKMRDRITI